MPVDSRWRVGARVDSLPLSPSCDSQMEEELYNPDYVEVDRVLEVSYCEDKDTGEVKGVPSLKKNIVRMKQFTVYR